MSGYVAAWLGERAPIVSALATGLLIAGADLVGLSFAHAPMWGRCLLPLLLLVLASLGGILRVIRSPSTAAHRTWSEGRSGG